MESSFKTIERTYVRLIVGGLLACILVILLCWAGFRFHHAWQEKRLLSRAAEYLKSGDLRLASLSARRAHQSNQDSSAVLKMLAEVAEAGGERAALDWRRKAVTLEPESAPNQIALAKSALRFGETSTAEKALSLVKPDGRSAAYYAAAAQLAEADKKPAEAHAHWTRALKLDPANKTYELQLAITSLRDSNASAQESARRTLENLRTDRTHRAAATRALLQDGAAYGQDPEQLISLARELQGYPEAAWSDALLYLQILRQLEHPDFPGFLTAIQQRAAGQPKDLGSLITWMNKNSLSVLALNYTGQLPAELLSAWPVPLALAESYSVLSDWASLERWANSHSWGDFDYLRRAYLARALRGQDKGAAAEKEWNAAKKDAANQMPRLATLARAAIEWRWNEKGVELLWLLAKDPVQQHEALRGLYQHYVEVGDTPGIYRTLVRLVEARPSDLSLQNNLAQVGLLLNAQPEKACHLAAGVYEKEPRNPAYVSTYAFSLFSKGDAFRAVRTMESLSEEQLQEPGIAGYYGVFLAATGDRQKARKYLEVRADALQLPEEKELVARAVAKLN